MINEVIKILYDNKAANKLMRKYRKAFGAFKSVKLTIPKKHAVAFDDIANPEVNFIHDTESL